MKRVAILLACLLAVLALLSARAWARQGKVFFTNGKWIKGDVQVQSEDSGRAVVVIAMKTGSVIFPKDDVANIIYKGNDASPHGSFYRALKNTPSESAAQKSIHVPPAYETMIEEASQKNKLDPHLVKAVIRQESNFNARDISRAGAQGLMQLMPGTARALGVGNSFDPYQNVHGGAKYLKLMLDLFDGDLTRALAAYNAGPNAVIKYGQIPPYKETRHYVRQVLKYYDTFHVSRLTAFNDEAGGLVITDRPYSRRSPE